MEYKPFDFPIDVKSTIYNITLTPDPENLDDGVPTVHYVTIDGNKKGSITSTIKVG